MKILSSKITDDIRCECCHEACATHIRLAFNDDNSLIVEKSLCNECPFEVPMPVFNLPVEIEEEGRRLKLQIISDEGLDFDINVKLNFKPDNDKLWDVICKELGKQEKKAKEKTNE